MRLLNNLNNLMDRETFLLVGKIVGVHGLKGDLKVYPYTETLQTFKPGQSIRLKTPSGFERVYKIYSAKPHKKILRVSLNGIPTIDSAENFIGSEIFIEKGNLPDLEEDAYYWFEIIGLSVFLKDNTFIGKVTAVIPTGSNDVYVVKNPDKSNDKEILIPAIASVVLDIDLNNQRMSVDLPEGLD